MAISRIKKGFPISKTKPVSMDIFSRFLVRCGYQWWNTFIITLK